MKSIIKKIPTSVQIHEFVRYILRYAQYSAEFREFSSLQKKMDNRFGALEWRDRYPCLADKTQNTSFDAHYTYHPAWAARIVAQIQPLLHVESEKFPISTDAPVPLYISRYLWFELPSAYSEKYKPIFWLNAVAPKQSAAIDNSCFKLLIELFFYKTTTWEALKTRLVINFR